MKRIGRLKAAVLCLACLGMLVPTPVLNAAVSQGEPARQTTGQPPAVIDVALQAGGTLHGQVCDSRNTLMPQTPVFLVQANRPVRNTVTDRSGGFSFSELRGGTYQILSGRACGTYRLWAPNTAPPLARSTVLVSEQQDVVRGQTGPIGYWLSNPWVLASLVAVAVAVPVIIHNSRSNRVASP